VVGNIYVEDNLFAMKLDKEMSLKSSKDKTILNLNLSEIGMKFGK